MGLSGVSLGQHPGGHAPDSLVDAAGRAYIGCRWCKLDRTQWGAVSCPGASMRWGCSCGKVVLPSSDAVEVQGETTHRYGLPCRTKPAARGRAQDPGEAPEAGQDRSSLPGAVAAARDVVLAGAGLKLDGGKARWDLLPWPPVREVVEVLEYGARKYAPENWRKVENGRERYFAAAMRHMTAWRDGELRDQESGLPHLAHAMCCLLFIRALEREGQP